jgi:hypothetical protein
MAPNLVIATVAWGEIIVWTPPASAMVDSPRRRLSITRCTATREELQAV